MSQDPEFATAKYSVLVPVLGSRKCTNARFVNSMQSPSDGLLGSVNRYVWADCEFDAFPSTRWCDPLAREVQLAGLLLESKTPRVGGAAGGIYRCEEGYPVKEYIPSTACPS